MSRQLLDLFVGREKELRIVEQQIAQHGTLKLVSAGGPGGIGKTSLLRYVQREYRRDPSLLVSDIIDFDEVSNRVTDLLGRRMADTLGRAYFDEYLQAVDTLDKMTASGLFDQRRLEQERERVNDVFFECYARLAQEKRLVLLFDTIEVVQDLDAGRRLLREVGPRTVNTVILLAGRKNAEIESTLKEIYGAENVACLPLEPFTLDETADFFEELELKDVVDPAMQEKLNFLADGKPILLGLAVEWLRREIPLPEITSHSMSALRALPSEQLQELKERFEFELVSGVRSLREPRDLAVAYMAHFERRCDVHMLAILMGMPEEQVKKLVDELTDLFFVKPLPKLQDEMAALVKKHVWPYLDPQGVLQHGLTRKIIAQYYKPAIQQLDAAIISARKAEIERKRIAGSIAVTEEVAWEKWVLEAERLHYELTLDPVEGYAYFQETMESALRSQIKDRAELLLAEVEDENYRTRIADRKEIAINIPLKRARLMRLGPPTAQAEAEKTFRRVLRQKRLDSRNKLEALSALASLIESPGEAVRLYKQGVRLTRQIGDENLLGQICNYLGLKYRQLGKPDEARRWYTKALYYVERTGDKRQAGATINNLAYVYRQLGKAEKAEELCKTALNLREQFGNERELALSYQTYGEFYSDMRDTWRALEYFNKAAETYKRIGAEAELGQVYVHIANIYRQQHFPNRVEEHLNAAIDIFQRLDDKRGLADAYNEYGCEYRKRGWELWRESRKRRESVNTGKAQANSASPNADFALTLNKAESYLEQSLKLAQESEHWYKYIDSLVDLCLVCSYRYQIDHDPRYKEQAHGYMARAEEKMREYPFDLFAGRLEEFRGDFLLAEGEYHPAFVTHYVKACEILAGYTSERYRETFKRVTAKLWELDEPPAEVRRVCDNIIEACRKSKKARKLGELIRVCEEVKRFKGEEAGSGS